MHGPSSPPFNRGGFTDNTRGVMESDDVLLARYAENGTEAAFAELVRRHVGAVQAAALRQTAQPDLAQDVTQAVFVCLARKAGQIRPGTVLIGWLMTTTRFLATDLKRREARRAAREDQYAGLQPDSVESADTAESIWNEIGPALDAALARLKSVDRDAILLRFFQNQPLARVGAALGLTEDAARKRVDRAVDRLRTLLARAGVVATGAGIMLALETQAAPVATGVLVQTTTAAALNPSTAVLAIARRVLWREAMYQVAIWLLGFALCAGGAALAWRAWPSSTGAGTSQQTVVAEGDYRLAGFPDPAPVNRLVVSVQAALRANQSAPILPLVQYPLRVNLNAGNQTRLINSAEALGTEFTNVFTGTVTRLILKSPARRLYADTRGVMVGDGTLWIGPAGDPRQPTPRIIAINIR